MTKEGEALLADLLRFKPEGLSPNGWAVDAGVNRTVWNDIRRHGNPSRRTLQKLLGAAGSSLAEFEALRIGATAAPPTTADSGLSDGVGGWRGRAPYSIPVHATASLPPGGADDAPSSAFCIDPSVVEDRIDCPPQLAGLPGLYAIRMVNRSMWPRFREGRRLVIAPSLGAAAAVGDDVLVQLRSARGLVAIVGELADRDGSAVSLVQYTPNRRLAIAGPDVVAVHRVVGEIFEG